MSHTQTMSLFPEMSYQTKAQIRERTLKSLGIIESVKPRRKRVRIKRLDDDYPNDLFSFSFVSERKVEESRVKLARKEWTGLEVAILHEQLLILMLKDIKDSKVSDGRIKEWLLWAEGLENDYGRPLPFSFEACCQFWGFDPDEFRHRVAYVMRNHRKWNIRWRERSC